MGRETNSPPSSSLYNFFTSQHIWLHFFFNAVCTSHLELCHTSLYAFHILFLPSFRRFIELQSTFIIEIYNLHLFRFFLSINCSVHQNLHHAINLKILFFIFSVCNAGLPSTLRLFSDLSFLQSSLLLYLYLF